MLLRAGLARLGCRPSWPIERAATRQEGRAGAAQPRRRYPGEAAEGRGAREQNQDAGPHGFWARWRRGTRHWHSGGDRVTSRPEVPRPPPSGAFSEQACFTSQTAMRAGILILLPCSAAFSGLAGVPAPRLRRVSSPLLQDVTRPARGDRGTADGQVVAVLTRASWGRPYCTYGLRGPAFCLPHVPEAQGSLPPGPRALHVRRAHTSLGRAARTVHRVEHHRPWRGPVLSAEQLTLTLTRTLALTRSSMGRC